MPPAGRQRNLRRKRSLEDEEDGAQGGPAAQSAAAAEVQAEALEAVRLLQRQRKRPPGVDASKLVPAARGDDEGGENELMDAQYVKAVGENKSQILDEKVHMEQFIEKELARRLGKSVEQQAIVLSKAEQEERDLYQLPEGLKASVTQEVSLPGMMTAITEVEVSKESKMQKIEETEAVKHSMLLKQMGASEANQEAERYKRSALPFEFGRGAPKKYAGVDAAKVHERRRVISERSVDPVDVARRREQLARSRGGA